MTFSKFTIDGSDNFFPQLLESVEFEEFSKGRRLAVLHRPGNNGVPLVRTTTAHQRPSQPFKAVHEYIVTKIKEESGIESLDLNNAMLEIYDSRYRTMGYHSDQALDLDPESYISLFSCYEKGQDRYPRTLTVKAKGDESENVIDLTHHSVVVFSVATNRRYLHKIEGRNIPDGPDNRWMGFTLRLSKTSIKFENDKPMLVVHGEQIGELTIATEKERKAFYKSKSSENKSIDYEYPEIRYTISPSDLMPPSS